MKPMSAKILHGTEDHTHTLSLAPHIIAIHLTLNLTPTQLQRHVYRFNRELKCMHVYTQYIVFVL